MNMLKTIRKTQENDLTSIKEKKNEVKEKKSSRKTTYKPHIHTYIYANIHISKKKNTYTLTYLSI